MQLLPVYRAELDRAHAFVAERELVSIPHDPVDVVPTPAFLVALVPFAAYEPPPIFLSEQTGRFYVTQPDASAPPEVRARQRRGHCRHAIPAMVAHEAYPGHHLQLVTAQGLASEVRRHIWTPVMVEGWALYCEQLMDESGYYGERPGAPLPAGESPLARDPDRARRRPPHPGHGAGGGGGLHGGAPADRAGERGGRGAALLRVPDLPALLCGRAARAAPPARRLPGARGGVVPAEGVPRRAAGVRRTAGVAGAGMGHGAGGRTA